MSHAAAKGTTLTDLIDRVVARADAQFDQSVERLQDFLRIPSVGTDPQYADDTVRAGQWLTDQLSELGFDAKLIETDGQPIVFAKSVEHDEGGPHLLYYGHYDVQPADPVDLWDSPPFEPSIVDGPRGKRIVARGAVDDKGQVMTWIEAFRAWKEVHGRMPLPITIFIEGEEESASPNLEPFMEAYKDRLKADVCIISDTGMIEADQPAITTMLRGIVYTEVNLTGPNQDLHSGIYGGGVVNPINELSKLIAGLHDDQGRVTLDGFYDAVQPVDPTPWQSIGFDEDSFLNRIGLEKSTGEADRSLLERVWSRPTLDCNGIWGGYIGEGAKTVIPSMASAKVSCRLVPNQSPADIFKSIERYFQSHCPQGCKVEVKAFGLGSPSHVPTDTPTVKAAIRALDKVFPHPASLIGCGGSIPVSDSVKNILEMDTLLLGFGLDDDRVHSPNEKFELVCLERGIKTHAHLLAELTK